MSLDTGSTNTTRYHSAPDSADWTLPDDDWCWFFTGSFKATGLNYAISTGAFGSLSSLNLYLATGSDFRFVYNNTGNTSGPTPTVGQEYLFFCKRTSNTLEWGFVDLFGTMSSNTHGTSLSGTTSDGTGLWLQSRDDLSTTRMHKGRLNNATFVSGRSVTDEELIQMAQGAPILSMPFMPSVVELFHFQNADNATVSGLIQGHVATRGGTGWGIDEYDILTPYTGSVSIPFSVAAVGDSIVALTAALFNTTAQDTQNATTVEPTTATLSFTAQAINVIEGGAATVVDLTTAAFNWTTNAVQNSTVVTTTTASFNYTANAINVLAAQVIALSAATFNYTAQSPQVQTVLSLTSAAINYTTNAIQLAAGAVLTAATFNWSAKDIATPVSNVIDLTTASFNYTANQVQIATTLSLSTASLTFTPKRVTIAVSGVVIAAGLLTLALLGVGK